MLLLIRECLVEVVPLTLAVQLVDVVVAAHRGAVNCKWSGEHESQVVIFIMIIFPHLHLLIEIFLILDQTLHHHDPFFLLLNLEFLLNDEDVELLDLIQQQIFGFILELCTHLMPYFL